MTLKEALKRIEQLEREVADLKARPHEHHHHHHYHPAPQQPQPAQPWFVQPWCGAYADTATFPREAPQRSMIPGVLYNDNSPSAGRY